MHSLPATTPPPLSRAQLPLDLMLLCGLMVLNAALSVLWPGTFTAVAALCLFFLLSLRLLLASPGAWVLLLPFLIIYIASQVSMIAIEAGGLMKEMGLRGAPSPASALFVLCNSLFVLTAVALHLRLLQRRPLQSLHTTASGPRPFILGWGAVAVVGLIDVYMALTGMRAGFPLLTGTDRFEFRRLTADILTLNFLNLKFIFAAFLGAGAAFATSRWQRDCHHGVFGLYLLISFLFGDKFFIILVAAAFYAMPLLIKHPDRTVGLVRRHLPTALLAVCCVFAVTVYIYSGYGRLSVEDTVLRVGDRIAGQGQLWHLAVRDSSSWVALDFETVRLNLLNLLANPASDFAFRNRLAAFHFVEAYSPTAMYMSYLTNAGTVTPTLVFEAYALVTFGYVGLVLALLAAGLLAGVLLTWLARALMSVNPFNVLLPAFVCTQLLAMMSQATLYSLLGLSAFKAYGAFLVLQLVMAELARPRRMLQLGSA